MIRHIVMWTLKDEAHGNDKATNKKMIKEKLESLVGKIEGLVSLEVGIDIGIEGNNDIVLNAVVKDRAALDVYQQHPDHQAILPFIRGAAAYRHALDYEI